VLCLTFFSFRNVQILLRVMSYMADVHEVTEKTVKLTITEEIKTCKSADKNRMDLICPPRQCDACQSSSSSTSISSSAVQDRP